MVGKIMHNLEKEIKKLIKTYKEQLKNGYGSYDAVYYEGQIAQLESVIEDLEEILKEN